MSPVARRYPTSQATQQIVAAQTNLGDEGAGASAHFSFDETLLWPFMYSGKDSQITLTQARDLTFLAYIAEHVRSGNVNGVGRSTFASLRRRLWRHSLGARSRRPSQM